MPDLNDSASQTDERLRMLRRRITLCRKVLARLHDSYIAEMREAQLRKETVWTRRKADTKAA